MINPLTDRVTTITLPISGRKVELIEPGKLQVRSWRLTESFYKSYEPILETAINNWPKETTFKVPDSVSPNTFIARVRDARLALRTYKYNPTLAARYDAVGYDLAFCYDPPTDSVICRKTRAHSRSRSIPDANSAKIVDHGQFGNAITQASVTDIPSETELRAIVLMISTQRMSGGQQFRGKVAETLRLELETNNDVVFVWDEATGITTLI